MITSITPGSGQRVPDTTAYAVRTSSLHDLCADLERALQQGRQLLDHPGRVRGRAQDAGDDGVRQATLLFASRWEWGLTVLVDDIEALLTDLRSATRLYDEVERTAVPGGPLDGGPPR